ncbi:Hypothetical protein FKW44_000854 [Caligus rogercresseyi]|uniref:Uncharacterized protein n=1 Tax=Caligus rogercresseyi TaxID=217165 RepID=A0A7T8GWH5_CALRO|nr:Hypothetical protein FKW44_019734 [Caligus rogercresseyi]QQP40235.1 Hypothetical protein FKW44_014218 [Caligus rogercresseyi]QQP56255.1 Hypothetical protein FKW44_000854 [Caligus rogercresseyi]
MEKNNHAPPTQTTAPKGQEKHDSLEIEVEGIIEERPNSKKEPSTPPETIEDQEDNTSDDSQDRGIQEKTTEEGEHQRGKDRGETIEDQEDNTSDDPQDRGIQEKTTEEGEPQRGKDRGEKKRKKRNSSSTKGGEEDLKKKK